MKYPIGLHLILLLLGLTSCQDKGERDFDREAPSEVNSLQASDQSDRIQVLNFGTFHFGATSDENRTEFDENSATNQKQAQEVAKKLAAFQPTVIVVEIPWSSNQRLQSDYSNYLTNTELGDNPTEVEMIGYEVGRLSAAPRIFGIDHKMGYNYRIARDIESNEVDSAIVNAFYADQSEFFPVLKEDKDEMPLLDKLTVSNKDEFLDFLITVNADILTHAASEGNFEGADEATKYYQRNLRMFTNLNRIDLSPDDRVFIIMGASHTAFFRDFISRSPKYEMVNTLDYLQP